MSFLEHSITVDNCPLIIEIAKKFNLEGLIEKIIGIVGSNPVQYEQMILTLSIEDFKKLLKSDLLNIEEIEVLNLIKKWITTGNDENRDCLSQLLENVRWEIIPSQYIIDHVVNDPALTFGSGAKTIMAAMTYHLSKV